MKNEHIPFELIEQIHSWVEDNLPNTNEEDYKQIKTRLGVIQQTINNLNKLSLDIPRDLFYEEKALKELLTTPSEGKQIMLEIVEKLQELIKYIKQNVLKKRNSENKGHKSPRKTLYITLQNGETIIENTATMTFLKTLEYIGLEKIADNYDVLLLGHPVVSRVKNPNGHSLKRIGDFFIETNSSTNTKADILRRYAHILSMNIQVTVQD